MRVVAPLCAAVALLVAACAPKGETPVKDSAATAAPPVVDVAAVRQAIEQANDKYVDGMIRGPVGVPGSRKLGARTTIDGERAHRREERRYLVEQVDA